MHKVVIIDDEPIIVEGISKLVPWEKYHCAVAGTAGNGREGLEVIRKIRPDMIFSDIAMPGSGWSEDDRCFKDRIPQYEDQYPYRLPEF